MKVPLSWLKEYLPTKKKPEEIAHLLTQLGLEVEAIDHTNLTFKGVIVGKVISVEPHPTSEKLQVAQVSDGQNTVQVVCGAFNCRAGLKTAFAPLGAELTDESGKTFKIKPVKLRGVDSFGMLCSHEELKLSECAVENGIMELPEHLHEGASFNDLFGDTILEVALTPNLNYCSSITGVARELSISTQERFHGPHIKLPHENEAKIDDYIKVSVQDSVSCPRYACRVILGVKVEASPVWLIKRLESIGIRSINNVVDATNFVLHEMGYPLHAFDYDRIDGKELIIRKAEERESFVTLDEKERFPTTEALMIADRKKSLALAGIMGGLNCEVGLHTQNILIEAAYFNPSTIRRASKQLGLQTEASKRFERGVDPNGPITALNRACQLILDITQGTLVKGIIDIQKEAFTPKVIFCRLSRVNALLGTQLALSEVETILRRDYFKVSVTGPDKLTVEVPTYRNDINEEIDLIEEVAKIYGYENLDRKAKPYQDSTIPHTPLYIMEKRVRTCLLGEGLQELLNCNLISPTEAAIVEADGMPHRFQIKLLNPSSIEQSVMRSSLLPGLLKNVKLNLDHQNTNIAGFEIGKVHFKTKESYVEPTCVSIVLSGNSTPHHWDKKPQEFDFYDLKGILENLFQALHLSGIKYEASKFANFHPGRQAELFYEGQKLGIMGEIHPDTLRKLTIDQKVFFAELNLIDLMSIPEDIIKMKPLAQYPASERDWTVTLGESFPIQKLIDSIKKINSSLLEEISIIDLYRSEKIGINRKNVTLRFIYRDPRKTISIENVEREHTRILQEVEKQLTVSH